MPEPDTSREEELRQLLTDAIEVQLAALKAGVGFWTEWIEKTTNFVDTATKTLSNINSDDPQTKDVLLELVDAGRASAREMTEIPRNTATRFLDELDKFQAQKIEAQAARRASKKSVGAGRGKRSAAKSASASSSAAKKASRSRKKARPKRAGRVKE